MYYVVYELLDIGESMWERNVKNNFICAIYNKTDQLWEDSHKKPGFMNLIAGGNAFFSNAAFCCK